MADALFDLQQLTGLMELTFVKTDMEESTTHLKAVGKPAAINHLTKILDERLAACDDILREEFEVPLVAANAIFNKKSMVLLSEIESASGAKLSFAGQKDFVRDTAKICIRGTDDQIDQAMGLVLERIQREGSKGEGEDTSEAGLAIALGNRSASRLGKGHYHEAKGKGKCKGTH